MKINKLVVLSYIWAIVFSGQIFAYTHSFPLSQLPAVDSLKKIALNTVGIEVRLSPGTKRSCSGTMITESAILTAAHCLMTSDNSSTATDDQITVHFIHSLKTIVINYDHYTLHFPKDYNRLVQNGKMDTLGRDIAIIELRNLLPLPMPNEIRGLINSSDHPIQQQNSYLFMPGNMLYGVAYGHKTFADQSESTFHFAKQSTTTNSSDAGIKYSDLDSKYAVDLKLQHRQYIYDKTKDNHVEEIQNGLKISNTNFVYIYSSRLNNQDGILQAEPGNSGGPIIACA